VIIMSGYPYSSLLVASDGWGYIDKPFAASLLVTKIKKALGTT
jgi:hypothetical protein